jgi:hypothetical protein
MSTEPIPMLIPPAAGGGETASSAVAAQARAMIESRYVIAQRFPRDIDQVRQDVLAECRRPQFANNKSSLYLKPMGGEKAVEGLGIRFVEVALRCMKNVMAESIMVYNDTDVEIHCVIVTDLESNATWKMDVPVAKTVERSTALYDGSYISVRRNTYNKVVYTVPAQEDALLNKRGALISKASRTLGLRLIPGDLQEEATEIIRQIRLDKAAADPGAERKAIADAFANIGVKADALQKYLGHSLDTCSPHELVNLRGLYGAIKDGETTWGDVVESKRQQSEEPGADGPKRKSDAAPPFALVPNPPIEESDGWDSSKTCHVIKVIPAPKKGQPFTVEAKDDVDGVTHLFASTEMKLQLMAASAEQSGAAVRIEAKRDGDTLTLLAIEEVGANP